MKKLFLFLYIIIISISCSRNNYQNATIQNNKNSNSNVNLFFTIQENPIDFDINENGIVVLSYSSKKNNGNIITNYYLHLYSHKGKELKKVIIYNEKNKLNPLNPKENLIFEHVNIVNKSIILLGTRILKGKWDADSQFKIYNMNLKLLNNINTSYTSKIRKIGLKAFILSQQINDNKQRKNKLFRYNQVIYPLYDYLNNIETNTLILQKINIPKKFDKSIIEILCIDFTVNKDSYYLLCKAKTNISQSLPLLLSIDKNSKKINWYKKLKQNINEKIYYPSNSISISENLVAFTFLQNKNTYVYIVNNKGEIHSKYTTKNFKIPNILNSINSTFSLSGSMLIDKKTKTDYENLSKALYNDKAFVNYTVTIDKNGNFLTENHWALENSEDIIQTKVFKKNKYFLSRAFISWPGKKKTNIYILKTN